jgi:4-alpha-glucanotransferase
MKFPRCSGILLHITSLPSAYGIGDLGKCARQFATFLADSGQKIWQVLPLGPTGYGDSPYQCFSAFAGNPVFIDLDALREQDLLTAAELQDLSTLPCDYVDYGPAIRLKYAALRQAGDRFRSDASNADRERFAAFCESNSGWLDDYAVFMAIKTFHHGSVWTRWDSRIRQRQASALQEWTATLSREVELNKYWQFEFFRQWSQLQDYCHQLGIRIMGDVPIYVAHDSADVWAHPQLFQLDAHGNPTVVGGVPPDYFSATGQLWGNPLYHWEELANSGYEWWIDRFRASLRLFDLVRLDHFRGFEAYWEVPAEAASAVNGKWVKGPGAEFFRALQAALGAMPIVAENLGVITPEVEAIRREFGFPGMSLLQFAFGNDPQGPSFRPHNYSRELVAYTGGHDNDTTVGWWTSSGTADSTRVAEDVRKEREFAQAYLAIKDESINWSFIRAILASVADTAIIPLQDVLGLGSEARMNRPGTVAGNWKWRYQPAALTDEIAHRLKKLTLLYDR